MLEIRNSHDFEDCLRVPVGFSMNFEKLEEMRPSSCCVNDQEEQKNVLNKSVEIQKDNENVKFLKFPTKSSMAKNNRYSTIIHGDLIERP